jgi:hypothetical protein
LFDALGVTLTPAERREIEAYATRSLVAFIEFSRGSRAEAFGDYAAAQNFYAAALRLDPSFTAARARITELQLPTLLPFLPASDGMRRATALSTDLINRPMPVAIGSGADAPVTSTGQLVTFTIVFRTP